MWVVGTRHSLWWCHCCGLKEHVTVCGGGTDVGCWNTSQFVVVSLLWVEGTLHSFAVVSLLWAHRTSQFCCGITAVGS